MISAQTGGTKQRRIMYHYTDAEGFKAISANSPWTFRASRPRRADNPVGAYFTPLPPDTKNLAERIGVDSSKLQFYFAFLDAGDLRRLNPDRPIKAQVKFYSPTDYEVEQGRQIACGENPSWT